MTYYSINDTVAEKFLTPVLMHTDQEAIRWFKSVVNRDESVINDAPETFILYKLAEFDERHGNIIPNVKKLISGDQVKKEVK